MPLSVSLSRYLSFWPSILPLSVHFSLLLWQYFLSTLNSPAYSACPLPKSASASFPTHKRFQIPERRKTRIPRILSTRMLVFHLRSGVKFSPSLSPSPPQTVNPQVELMYPHEITRWGVKSPSHIDRP